MASFNLEFARVGKRWAEPAQFRLNQTAGGVIPLSVPLFGDGVYSHGQLERLRNLIRNTF
jgi:hypothetical protein